MLNALSRAIGSARPIAPAAVPRMPSFVRSDSRFFCDVKRPGPGHVLLPDRKPVAAVIGGLGRVGRSIAHAIELNPEVERVYVVAGKRPDNDERVEKANRHGIQLDLEDAQGAVTEHTVGGPGGKVRFTTDAAEVPEGSSIFSATTVNTVVKAVAPFAGHGAVDSTENGLAAMRLKEHFPDMDVGEQSVYFSAKERKDNPQRIRLKMGGTLQTDEKSHDETRKLLAPEGGIHVVKQPNSQAIKVIVNSGINGLGIILGKRMGEAISMPEYIALMRAVAAEGTGICKAAGIDVGSDEEVFRRMYRLMHHNAGDHTSSYAMMCKLEPGEFTEIPEMNGALAGLAKQRQIDAPINTFIDSIIDRISRWMWTAEHHPNDGPEDRLARVRAEHSAEFEHWARLLLGMGQGHSQEPPAA